MFTYNTQFLDKTLTLIAVPHGRDFSISVMGGDRFHIGAVAICVPSSVSSVTAVPGHKEDALALELASSISYALNCVISVSIGIHYDNVSKYEIGQILQLVNSLKDDFVKDVLLNS